MRAVIEQIACRVIREAHRLVVGRVEGELRLVPARCSRLVPAVAVAVIRPTIVQRHARRGRSRRQTVQAVIAHRSAVVQHRIAGPGHA